MPLTVGELVGYASLDDRELDRGADRVEARMRDLQGEVTAATEQAGEEGGRSLAGRLVDQVRAGITSVGQALGLMTPQAQAAGAEAGDAAGEALAQEVEAGARAAGAEAGAALGSGLESEARAAGAEAGDAAADALDAELEDGAEQAGADAGEAAGATLKERLLAGAAAAGLLAGAALAAGLSSAMEQEKSNSLLAAQLGASPEMARQFGGIAGRLYAQAYGENIGEVNEALKGVWQQGLVDEDAATAEIEKVAAGALNLSEILAEDVGKTSAAVGTMIKTGLAANAQEAFDILVVGAQNGANKAEDLLDTFNEYPVQFKRVGLDGQTAMGLISQAMQKGARDSDQVADALGQFGERALAGGTAIEDAYKSIGLNADEVAAKIGKGGTSATQALQMTLDALRGTKDEQVKLNAAAALFGDPANVMGDALYAMNPATALASTGLDKMAGAADRAGATLHDNASTKLEAFKRQVTQAFVEQTAKAIPYIEKLVGWLRNDLGPVVKDTARFVRDDLVPAVKDSAKWVKENETPIKAVAAAITIFLLPALIRAGVTALVSAGQQVVAWLSTSAASASSAVVNVASSWAIVGGWIRAAVQAVASAAVIVGRWVWMGVQAMIQAARMAAAWLIAMGPIGWVTLAVIAIAALVIYYWDEIVAGTKAAWTWVKDHTIGAAKAMWDWIKGAWSSATGWISEKTGAIKDSVVGAFVRLKDGAVQKGGELVGWVRGLPGEIVGGLGHLGGLLWSAGEDLIRGLIGGVKSMAGRAVEAAKDVARSAVSGVKNILGISSPSKVMRDQVGRWIPAGIAEGIKGASGQVDAAMRDLVPVPGVGPAAAMAANRPPADAWAAPGAAANRPGLSITNYYESDSGSAAETAAELDWLARNG